MESPLLRALNHLLDAEPWAREQLAPFAGETVELRAPWLPALRFGIGDGGRAIPAGERGEPALTVAITPEAIAALATDRGRFAQAVALSGNAQLAAAARQLIRSLRWDAEEDLSAWVGDAAAHRLMSLARELIALQADGMRHLAEGMIEYATEEKQLLTRREEFDALRSATARLLEDLDRLEERVASLG